jgi:outer membrane protein OmpA-like peptidoglycan-associated protein
VRPLPAPSARPASRWHPPPAKQARLERAARETVRAGVAAPGLLGSKPAAPRHAGPIRSNLVPPGGAEKLPPALRRDFEARLGIGLEGVRLHRGGAAAERADEAGAHALATGDDIVFGTGRYRPDTEAGRALLMHELAHVAQSRTGAADGETLRDGPKKQGPGSAPPEAKFDRGEGMGPEDDHVLFDLDKIDLDAGDMAVLRGIAAGRKEPAIVDVYGYSSSEGDADYNGNLSAHRAVKVKQALEGLLPAGSEITAHAHGAVTEFGGPAENRRAGVKVRQSTPLLDPGALLAPYRRRSGLLGGTLQLKLDPTLFKTPLGFGPGQKLPGGSQGAGIDLDPVAKPVTIPGIGGTPWNLNTQSGTGPPWSPPMPLWSQPMRQTRPEGVRLEDFDLSPFVQMSSIRGVTLGGDFVFNLQSDFIRQTDELMKLGIPPAVAGFLVSSSLEKAAEYKFKAENPNFLDINEQQDKMRGFEVKEVTIDLLKVPGYVKKIRKFTGW